MHTYTHACIHAYIHCMHALHRIHGITSHDVTYIHACNAPITYTHACIHPYTTSTHASSTCIRYVHACPPICMQIFQYIHARYKQTCITSHKSHARTRASHHTTIHHDTLHRITSRRNIIEHTHTYMHALYARMCALSACMHTCVHGIRCMHRM